MQVIGLPITKNEEKNYSSVAYCFKSLSLTEWIKTYLFVAAFAALIATGVFVFSGGNFIAIWEATPKVVLVLGFVAVFVFAAYRRAKSRIMHELQVKYAEGMIQKEMIDNHRSLKKIQVKDGELQLVFENK